MENNNVTLADLLTGLKAERKAIALVLAVKIGDRT